MAEIGNDLINLNMNLFSLNLYEQLLNKPKYVKRFVSYMFLNE